MSAQAGIWNFDGKPVDAKLLAEFSEALKHQSPDGEYSFVNGNIAMLYRPFYTTADSRHERQPYVSRRGFVLTWDGRLDNRDELIVELQPALGRNPSDVEIVATAFDLWTTDCFCRIVGDWAVTVWKPEQREIILASDYMCLRHLFYYSKEAHIWWSTDLAPLVLLSGDKFQINDDYIAGYFAHDPDAQLTPYRGIHQVPGGHFVSVHNAKALAQRYWRFNPASRIRYKTDAEYEDHFRDVFRRSVKRRLRSDSPILAELSGGLDSSAIVCMADDIHASDGIETTRVDTVSYFDKTEPNGDDWIYFNKVEEKRGTIGAHIDTSGFGAAASLRYPDFLSVPGSLGTRYPLEGKRADIVRNGGYRVVLSGIGGDEFLGGVPDPTALLADLIVQVRLISLVKQLSAWSLVKRRPWIHLLGKAVADLLPPSVCQYFVKHAKPDPWIQKGFAKRTKIAIRKLCVNEHFGLLLPTRRSHISGVLLMANKISKASSA